MESLDQLSDQGSHVSDPDGVYKEAVAKLRILLSAAEVASMRDSSFDDEEEEEAHEDERGFLPYAGSVEQLHRGGFTDPPKAKRTGLFKKNPAARGATGARRALFANKASQDMMHSSWHNLVHMDEPSPDQGVELSLLERQEAYIAQLEKETAFCRSQLTYVLRHVKDVLRDRDHQYRAEEMNKAVSDLFLNLKEGRGKEDYLQAENVRLRSEIQAFQSKERDNTAGSGLLDKLKQDNQVLTEAIKKLRFEVEELRSREEEAVEQVKNSVQVAEQVRMEKTELDYEIGQLKMQVERQQGRIRALIEEQVTKIDSEREAIEKRSQEKVKQAKDELNKQVEELERLSIDLERQRRVELELRRQLQDRDQILENVKADTEKRLGKLQLELVSSNSSRDAFEEELAALRVELDHKDHELRSDATRNEAELKSVRSRLTKAEEMLMKSRKECLELAEVKAALERELNLARIQMDGSPGDSALNLAKNDLHKELTKTLHEREESHKLATTKLEDLIRRQSHIIGELKHQCAQVTDKLEDAVKVYESDKTELTTSHQKLLNDHQKLSFRAQEAEAQLSERGRLQERLCQRLEEVDLEKEKLAHELRSAWLKCDTEVQEKKVLQQEASFLKEILRSQGIIPEKGEIKKSHKSSKDNKEGSSSNKQRKIKSQAIVVERNGQFSSPFIK